MDALVMRKREINTPNGLKIGPRAPRDPGGPGGRKNHPQGPLGSFKKIKFYQKKSYFIILTRFWHFWMPDSNSALKIIQVMDSSLDLDMFL